MLSLAKACADVSSVTAESLAAAAARAGVPQLVLVTSSALCEGPTLPGLSGASSLDEFEMSGDGMALPLGDVRRNAEQLAAQVRRSGGGPTWGPDTPPATTTSLALAAAPGAFTTTRTGGATGHHAAAASRPHDSLWQLHSASMHSSGAAADADGSGGGWRHTPDAAAAHMAAGAGAGGLESLLVSQRARAGLMVAEGGADGEYSNAHEGRWGEEGGGRWAEGVPPGMAPQRSAERAAGAQQQHGSRVQQVAASASAQGSGLLKAMASQLTRVAAVAAAAAEPLAAAASAAAADLQAPVGRAALVARTAASQAARAAVKGAAAAAAQQQGTALYGDPSSAWLVADDPATATRYVVIAAAPDLERGVALGGLSQRDLVAFESYGLGVKANKRLYAEATALYARFMPLVMEFLEAQPGGAGQGGSRVCFGGIGLGGSLAAMLLLMSVHRGLHYSALLPAVCIDAPAVLGAVPNRQVWQADQAGGYVTDDPDDVLEELLSRGVLQGLGLPQEAVRHILMAANPPTLQAQGHAQLAARGDAAASAPGVQAMLSSMLAAVSGQARHAAAPAGAAAAAAGQATSLVLPGVGGDPHEMQIFKPIGRVISVAPVVDPASLGHAHAAAATAAGGQGHQAPLAPASAVAGLGAAAAAAAVGGIATASAAAAAAASDMSRGLQLPAAYAYGRALVEGRVPLHAVAMQEDDEDDESWIGA